ncbi:hypothetical protein C7448_102273 [Tenacibaculum gallaicum]|uniref:Outer membrane protein n=1 Tax=Tenacibaculum gallaicum TaxID=561505 RepID=A0A3E0I7K9_9FLAO|nr:hypothetical protein [Tenacibaculum gallaicum]REH54748.1 hypothetical protein C7448_102273 [Tenacibaculum gallaicum]
MKKIFLFIGFLTISFFTANAQDISNNAIGLRLGDNDGFGAEITYQRRLSDANRLEIDLGLRNGSNYDGFKATGLYQWVWQLENRFNWYAGAGGGLGHWNINNAGSDTFIFAAGVVGIEYNFDIPLMLSLDYRPEIGFGDTYDGFNSDFGLSIRYQF